MSRIRKNLEYYRLSSEVETDIGDDNVSEKFANTNSLTEVSTIYVAASGSNNNSLVYPDGNDTTGTGLSDSPFLTLDKALTWVSEKQIPKNVSVDIVMASGHYPVYEQIESSFPESVSISILSEILPDDLTFTFASLTSSDTYPWDGTTELGNSALLTLLNVTPNPVGLVDVGDFVTVTDTDIGTNHGRTKGFFEIEAVSTNSISIRWKGFNQDGDTGTVHINIISNTPGDTTTGAFSVLKTVIETHSTAGIVVSRNTGIGSIKGIAFKDYSSPLYEGSIAIRLINGGTAAIRNCGTSGYRWGFVAELGASMFCTRSWASDCNRGILATMNGTVWLAGCISSNNSEGIHITTTSSSYSSADAPPTLSNNYMGYSIRNSSSARIINDTLQYNYIGVKAIRCSTGSMTSGVTFTGNTTDTSPTPSNTDPVNSNGYSWIHISI